MRIKKALTILSLLLLSFSIIACSNPAETQTDITTESPSEIPSVITPEDTAGTSEEEPSESPPVEYKAWEDALTDKLAALDPGPQGAPGPGLTWYQIFVYSFCDSNGDGIGDLNGITERLGYIKSMGFDGIWLSPIHPSSTYHKYNVRDYKAIDPEYGTQEDFDALIVACDALGIRVILDLVLNHTDIDHPWFSGHPEYYNISDQPGNGNWKRMPDGRYYECQFWDQMPDLNLDSTELRAEFEDICSYWLTRGVYGFRLDALTYFYSGNIEKNVEALRWLKNMTDAIKPGSFLVGEAWDTTNNLYQYYDSGIDSVFSFPFAGPDGMIARLVLNANGNINDYFRQTEAALDKAKSYNPGATNAPFFTNHDMARASGFLRRDENLIKIAWGLSLTQPGDAFLYYGEELGMSGSGKDENKRAPMFWTDDIHETGMAAGPPEMDAVSHAFPPAVLQVGDSGSIYSFISSAVRLRSKYPHIGRGTFDVSAVEDSVVDSSNTKAGAVLRAWQGSEIVVAYNVSSETAVLTLPGTLHDHLSATGKTPSQDGSLLTLPGFCIAILVL